MEAVKFNCYNQHISGVSDFVVLEAQGEIITGGEDFTLKTFKISTKENIEQTEISDEIMALAVGSNNDHIHFAVGQGKDVQLFEKYDLRNDEEIISIPLTSFNSNIRQIIFNNKHNTLIAFSEDDDLHIANLNLENKEVVKFKYDLLFLCYF